MKNLMYAFILSIFIHLLFFMNYDVTPAPKNSAQNTGQNQNKTSNVRFVQLKKHVQKPQEKAQKQSQQEPKKVAKKPSPQPKRPVIKKAKKTVPKPTVKQEVVPNYMKPLPKQPKTALEKEQDRLNKENLNDYKITPELNYNMLDEMTKSYLKLYGKEYNSFTKVQKIFLQNNLRDIGRITERYLRYPALAIRLKQQGMNVVEFTLYPNGDISDLKLTNSSGSTSLDENTLETIGIAYKDYPRPKEPTKIKIYVNYFGNFY